MRNYQPKKNNPYHLDHNLFIRMIYIVRDYKRMKDVIEELSGDLPVGGENIPGSEHGDPTLSKVIRIERMYEECRAIENALEKIPEEYRKVVFDKICFDKAYPLYADPSTYSRHKCRFLYHIAKNLMYI